MKWPLFVVSGPFLPQIWLEFEIVAEIMAEILTRGSKIKCLSGNETDSKLTVLVHFWAQFTPGKPNIFPKTKIFPETTSL